MIAVAPTAPAALAAAPTTTVAAPTAPATALIAPAATPASTKIAIPASSNQQTLQSIEI